MQSTRSFLRLGCPVRFTDRWQGTLRWFEADEDWTVLNIVISRGIFHRTEVRLPFSAAISWSDEALSLDCTSAQAFGRELPPVAAPARPLLQDTPVSTAGVRLAGALVDNRSRRVTHLVLARGRLATDRRLAAVGEVTFEGRVLQLAAQADSLPSYRPDPELLQAARDAMAADSRLTADDRRCVSVDVVDGVAYVSGNVRTPRAVASIRETVSAVPGLSAVECEVADDRRLEIDAGRALDAAGMSRYGRLWLRASLGELTVGGYVSAAAPTDDILKAAAAVPGVRSVLGRMEVAPQPVRPAPAPARPPAEPEPEAAAMAAPDG